MTDPNPPSLIIESQTLPNGISFPMVRMEGGVFLLDDRIETQISTFYLGQFPVTQALWTAVMPDNPSHFQGQNLPVEQVSWHDAKMFIRQLNEQLGLSGNRSFRLPTEAEWEYAARGVPNTTEYHYAGSDQLEQVGWCRTNCHRETQIPGMKIPNSAGLYDMSGNVWEWCADWWGSFDSGPLKDPTGPDSGSNHVLRGGSWNRDASICRVAYRSYGHLGRRYRNFGFRLSRTAW